MLTCRTLAYGTAALLLGCASVTPLPPHFQGNAEHPTFTRKRFFVAGASGDSPESAAANAKAAVAAQVSSQISSTLEDIQQSVSAGSGPASEAQRIESRVHIRADFAHAELIKVVEQIRAGDPESYWALAALDRGDAARMLESELAPILDEFNRAVDAALKAAQERRLKALFASRGEVSDKYKKVLSTGLMPQLAVLRGGFPGIQTTRARVDEVERAIHSARAELVGLIVSRNEKVGDPDLQQANLAVVDEVLAKSFQGLNIKVESLKGLAEVSPEAPGELKSRLNAIVALVDVKATARQSEMGLGVYFAYSQARVRLFRPATSELLADFSVGGGATKAGHRDAPKAVANSMKYMLKELNERMDQELASLK